MGCSLNPPLISVTICSFNGQRYIDRTLNSVLAQDYPNFEIVIVDDGSSDGTRAIIERFAAQHECIRAFFRSNHGLPASRNFSFAQTKGEWIAIIDQDDLCYPTRLSRQLGIAQCHPTSGVVFCNVDRINESDEVMGDYMSLFASPAAKHKTRVRSPLSSLFALPESFIGKGDAGNLLLTLGCFSASASSFIKRETVQMLGGVDETYSYACDYDFFVRAGFEVDFAYTWDILGAWRSHGEQASNTYGKVRHEIRAVYWRNCRGRNASTSTKAVLLIKICKLFVADFVRRAHL